MNILFDIDGTMYQTVGKPNETMVNLIHILRIGGANIYAWSGGGAKYAKRIVTVELGLPEDLFDEYFSKTEKLQNIDITIDDETVTAGKVNLQI